MRSVHGGSLNEEEFLEEGEQPSSKRRGVKMGAARHPSCRGHQEIMISNKTSPGGEAPHKKTPHNTSEKNYFPASCIVEITSRIRASGFCPSRSFISM